jgi:hypothetical protein
MSRVRIPPSPLTQNASGVSYEKKFKGLEEKRQAEMEMAQEEAQAQKEIRKEHEEVA